MSFFAGLLGNVSSALQNVFSAPIGALGDSLAYGVKSLFGQSEMQKYERQLKRNMAYQKEMIDYTNEANLAYNKDLTSFNNEETKKMTEYMFKNYESPEARMNLYKQAGLNPNLAINGSSGLSTVSSSASSGGASAPSSGASYQADKSMISTLMSEFHMQKEMSKAQLDYQKEQTHSLWLQNLAKEEEILQFEVDEDFRKLVDFTQDVADIKIEGNIKDGLSIPDVIAKAYTRKERVQRGMTIKSAVEHAIKKVEYEITKNSQQVLLKQISSDSKSLDLLQEKGYYKLYQEVENMLTTGNINQKNLSIITEELDMIRRKNKLDDIDNSMWTADWGLPRTIEYPLKALLRTIYNALAGGLNAFSGSFGSRLGK